jgi:simple sugar transport system substrate-binding protein
MVAAQERGKFAIGYHSDMRKVAPDAQLLTVTHQWGAYYSRRAREVLEGRWASGDVWGGVREGMVRVEGFGSKVPKAVQDEVLQRQKELAAGQLQPFTGPISDNEGRQVVAPGKKLTDPEILTMNYLVKGVVTKP